MFQTYTDLINEIVRRKRCKTYLEVGVQKGRNLAAVVCERKDGVDPHAAAPCNYHMMSDVFFEMAIAEGRKYDFIFVDGDHRFRLSLRDVEHSLALLAEGGTILMDNINPQTFDDTRLDADGGVWMTWAALRMFRRDLEMVAIDAVCGTGHGWGLIRRGTQKLFNPEFETHDWDCYHGAHGGIDWQLLEQFRVPLMNLVSQEVFANDVLPAWFPGEA